MSDNVDVANQLNDEAVERALANRTRSAIGLSPIDCEECGNPIEPKRREIIPGTEHCAGCARYLEDRSRFNSGSK